MWCLVDGARTLEEREIVQRARASERGAVLDEAIVLNDEEQQPVSESSKAVRRTQRRVPPPSPCLVCTPRTTHAACARNRSAPAPAAEVRMSARVRANANQSFIYHARRYYLCWQTRSRVHPRRNHTTHGPRRLGVRFNFVVVQFS